MELGIEQQKILADLHGHPGFLILCQSLKDFEDMILSKLEGLVDDKKIAHVARYYQFTHSIRVRLESEIENAFVEAGKQAAIVPDEDFFGNQTHPGQALEDFLQHWAKRKDEEAVSQ